MSEPISIPTYLVQTIHPYNTDGLEKEAHRDDNKIYAGMGGIDRCQNGEVRLVWIREFKFNMMKNNRITSSGWWENITVNMAKKHNRNHRCGWFESWLKVWRGECHKRLSVVSKCVVTSPDASPCKVYSLWARSLTKLHVAELFAGCDWWSVLTICLESHWCNIARVWVWLRENNVGSDARGFVCVVRFISFFFHLLWSHAKRWFTDLDRLEIQLLWRATLCVGDVVDDHVWLVARAGWIWGCGISACVKVHQASIVLANVTFVWSWLLSV